MKKYLLSLAAVAMVSTVASADTLSTLKFNTDGYKNGTNVSSYENSWKVTQDGTNNSWSIVNANNNNSGWTSVRIGASGAERTASITTDFAIAGEVNEVVVTGSIRNPECIKTVSLLASDKAGDFTTPVSTVTLSESEIPTTKGDANLKFTLPEPASNLYYRIEIGMKKLKNGSYEITKVEYNGTPATVNPADVAAPVISFDEETNTVTMTCSTEGASIYYRTDTADVIPGVNDNLYSEPFTVTESCVITAVAIKDDVTSPIASRVIELPAVYNSIASLLSGAAKNESFTLSCPVTYVYSNGDYNYITDGTDFINIFRSAPANTANGARYDGVSGIMDNYNGLPQIKNATYGTELESTDAVAPLEVTIPFCREEANLNKYVKLEGITIEAGEKARNYTATGADGESIAVYQQFKDIEIPEGHDFTMECFVSVYGTTYQVFPIAFSGGVILTETAQPVINPDGGTITGETEVVITCETEGASIYYTLDGTAPSQDATLYDGAITISGSCTVQAIAYAADHLPSQIASAEFIYDDGTTSTVTYNFTDTAELEAFGITAPVTVSTGTIIMDEPLVKGHITLTCASTSDSEDSQPKIWLTKNGTELRAYKDTTLHFEGDDKVDIKSITFTGNLLEGLENWTATDATVINSNVKIDTGKNQISTITVKYTTSTGVDNIAADNTDAPVEYYNLQGVRVEQPSTGLYIRRQGSETTKVIIR